jgi:virginiamycin B lyase
VRALLLAAVLSALAAGTAAAATPPIAEFTAGVTTPSSLVAGPDGNVWFVDSGTDMIGKITPAGQVTEYADAANPGMSPLSLVRGSDGNLWFSDTGSTKAIGRVTPAGQITEFTTGLLAGGAPTEMTEGPNGTVWFLDPMGKAVGRVTLATGAIKEFPYNLDISPSLDEIAAGPDGNIYFTDKGNSPGIGEVTPDGVVSEWATTDPTISNHMPSGIGGGPDGNVWFSDQGDPNGLGRLARNNLITEFTSGLQPMAQVDAVIPGPDGNVWFDDQLSTNPAVGFVTPSGTIHEFLTSGNPGDIVFGVDGNLWAAEYGTQQIQRITVAGVATTYTDGLLGTADLTDTEIIVGPDGNQWFLDRGTPKAIGRVKVQSPPAATTGAASAVTSTSATVSGTVNSLGDATTVVVEYGTTSALGLTTTAGTLAASGDPAAVSAALAGLPASTTIFYRVRATNAFGSVTGATQTFTTAAASTTTTTTTTTKAPPPKTTTQTTATVGDQLVSVVAPLPTACTATTKKLRITLSAKTIAHPKAAKVKFSTAALFLDHGVKHKRTKRVKGKRRTVVSFSANTTVHKLPARPSLKLNGLRSGKHSLKVKFVFKRRSGKGSALRKTVTVRFRVC